VPPPLLGVRRHNGGALNRAYNAGKVPTDAAWRKVKPFRHADAAVVRYLSDDEARRLVNACDNDFRLLVQAALLTGCLIGLSWYRRRG
jgi:hypothetical protein